MTDPNTYGFTTTSADEYVRRVTEEASPDANFILMTDRNTVIPDQCRAILAVRKDVLLLALVMPDAVLAGRSLIRLLLDETTNPTDLDWVLIKLEADEATVTREAEKARHTLARINNVANGRTVRVTVESY